jgi:DNA-binding GntR family transcriptional regulator
VSRSTVHKAVRALAAEGLIEQEPGLSWRVAGTGGQEKRQ